MFPVLGEATLALAPGWLRQLFVQQRWIFVSVYPKEEPSMIGSLYYLGRHPHLSWH